MRAAVSGIGGSWAAVGHVRRPRNPTRAGVIAAACGAVRSAGSRRCRRRRSARSPGAMRVATSARRQRVADVLVRSAPRRRRRRRPCRRAGRTARRCRRGRSRRAARGSRAGRVVAVDVVAGRRVTAGDRRRHDRQRAAARVAERRADRAAARIRRGERERGTGEVGRRAGARRRAPGRTARHARRGPGRRRRRPGPRRASAPATTCALVDDVAVGDDEPGPDRRRGRRSRPRP